MLLGHSSHIRYIFMRLQSFESVFSLNDCRFEIMLEKLLLLSIGSKLIFISTAIVIPSNKRLNLGHVLQGFHLLTLLVDLASFYLIINVRSCIAFYDIDCAVGSTLRLDRSGCSVAVCGWHDDSIWQSLMV